MESRNKQQNRQKPNDSTRLTMRQLLGADFLLDKKVVRWYPFILYVFVLMLLSVYNSKLIQQKESRLKILENEWQSAAGELRKSNQLISYDKEEKIISMMKDRGFVEDNKNTNRINVKGE
jgi:hypothetical protein